jgi:hypothetical protein
MPQSLELVVFLLLSTISLISCFSTSCVFSKNQIAKSNTRCIRQKQSISQSSFQPELDEANSIHTGRMGRRRKGDVQRSRWAPREVSPDFQVPQGVAEESGAANRVAKIEALVSRRQSGLIVVLEDPSDELNAGAVFRSCDAFGATEVWIIHNGLKSETSMRPHVERSEPFEAESKQIALASASASRWVASRTLESTHDAIAALRADGYFSVATCFTERSRFAAARAPRNPAHIL